MLAHMVIQATCSESKRGADRTHFQPEHSTTHSRQGAGEQTSHRLECRSRPTPACCCSLLVVSSDPSTPSVRASSVNAPWLLAAAQEPEASPTREQVRGARVSGERSVRTSPVSPFFSFPFLLLPLSSPSPSLSPSPLWAEQSRAEQRTDRSATARWRRRPREGGRGGGGRGREQEEMRRQGQTACVLGVCWWRVGLPFALVRAGLSLLCGRVLVGLRLTSAALDSALTSWPGRGRGPVEDAALTLCLRAPVLLSASTHLLARSNQTECHSEESILVDCS
jgi:hypothetical protein